ncbi:MAG: diguanylate cyclase, partial [Desulfuromusa sp.]|nr:diguanylate cyclase [Desulfuromusa sp.]
YHSSVSLVLLDIDFFKGVNDTYGHLAGDQVLINIAKAITSAVRPSDITVRYGGDEFAVIMPETSATGVKIFSSRLRRCIEGNSTLVDGHVVYITVSIGTTTLSPDQPGVTKDFLIKMADRGLYLSKDNGRNQVTNLDLNRCVEESDCLSFKSGV